MARVLRTGAAKGRFAVPVRVLLTTLETPSGLALQKTLHNYALEIFYGDARDAAQGFAHSVSPYCIPLPAADSADFVDAVLFACDRHAIDVVIPARLDHMRALAYARERIESFGVRIVGASASAIERCLDRWEGASAFRREGIAPSRVARLDEHFDRRAWQLPLEVRSCHVDAAPPAVIIQRWSELEPYLTMCDFFVTDVSPGVDYVVDMLLSPVGTVLAAVPYHFVSGEVGASLTLRTVRDEYIVSIARMAVLLRGAPALSTVYLRVDDDGASHVYDVLPGFSSLITVAALAGVNLPWLAVLGALGVSTLPAGEPFREITARRDWSDRIIAAPARPSLLPLRAIRNDMSSLDR